MSPDPFGRSDAAGFHRDDPVDPDFDRNDPAQRSELSTHRWTLPAISAGGVIGASGRYGLEQLWPHGPNEVPWATLVTNVTGCLLLGIVMVAVTETRPRHPLWRPFLGVGVVGGYTTFSTHTVQVQQAIEADAPRLALVYLLATLGAAMIAVTAGTLVSRALVRAFGTHRPPRDLAHRQPTREGRDGSGQAGR
ncbi:MAG: fluoride exporter [Actinomycetota bacterium]|jgi:CrcB protein|nr:fluoride exporter [Actinomycetota bacterium]MDQ1642880.1 fluoride exporter [Actinomycetota bacterium]